MSETLPPEPKAGEQDTASAVLRRCVIEIIPEDEFRQSKIFRNRLYRNPLLRTQSKGPENFGYWPHKIELREAVVGGTWNRYRASANRNEGA